LEPFATDPDFQRRWRETKLGNKQKLAELIEAGTGIHADPQTVFDQGRGLLGRVQEFYQNGIDNVGLLVLLGRIDHVVFNFHRFRKIHRSETD
jgi:starch phosphorylase